MCPRVASIGKCRAPRVNDDTLSARHCTTEFIYSIYPGTKVCGSSAGHRSLQWPASCSKPAAPASLMRAISTVWDRITSLRSVFRCLYETGLRRWRSVFLFPPTGYLTPKQKHVLHSQDFFFRAPASLTRASSRRSTGTRKKALNNR